ncbi:uncharacterized protein [Littorina saxatilis]|uniref:uncharacterized protein isoform X2 n=1 Tax=Littorina saxatilis TaxID=31220 RepID=UPI0038B58B15
MSEDKQKLVVTGDHSETGSVHEENGPQGEEEGSATQIQSGGVEAIAALTHVGTDKMPEDDQSRSESGASAGSSTPSITTYDIDGHDLQDVTVQRAEQDMQRTDDTHATEKAEMQEAQDLTKEELLDSEAADKLKQPTLDTEPDVHKREIVVEMLAMQADEPAGASGGGVMEDNRNGDSGDIEAASSDETTVDAEKSAWAKHMDKVQGTTQGFQIMEIFTDDDFDTVKEKWRRRSQCSARGKLLCCVCVVGVMAAILTAVLVPVSLVFVEYHEIALARSKLTGRVDRSQTIYPGCYLMFPDTELIRFQATGHQLRVDAHISSSEGLAVRLQLALQYFIKPEELGELYRKYAEKYAGVVRHVIDSEVRNQAVHLPLIQYRRDRAYVQQYLHRHLAERLQGNCCPPCCPRHCAVSRQYSGHNCSTCSQSPDCDSGFHVTLLPQHLQVLTLQLPDDLTERYLRGTLLQVELEMEHFLQQSKVESKMTEKLVKDIENTGREVLGAAKAEARQVRLEAEAEAEKIGQQAYSQAMGRLFKTLNLTEEPRRLALMNTLALKDFSDNFSFQHYDHLTVV